tara:strand:- start:145 stop:2505 length:2361 start_codon:yes stop_codon:yes gene_type:complete
MATEKPFPDPNDDLFYLLKETSRDDIGDAAVPLNLVKFFHDDDIGVIQSTALLQGLHPGDFIEVAGGPNNLFTNGDANTDWGGLVAGSPYEITAVGFSVSWNQGANISETEANFATAMENALNSDIPNMQAKWKDQGAWNWVGSKIVLDLTDSISAISSIANGDDLTEFFKNIRLGQSSYVNFLGQNYKLVNPTPQNIIDSINAIYGTNLTEQKEVFSRAGALTTISQVETFVNTQISRVQAVLGPVFSPARDSNGQTYYQRYQEITSTDFYGDAIINNTEAILDLSGNANFTGLSDTPTGYLSGQYLISTASGIDYQTISGLSKEISDEISSSQTLSFTGLSGTPSNYEQGKFLVSTDDGIEYTGNLSGVISSEEINWDVYQAKADLPNASDYHGMFAHVHSEGAAYMAHNGQWEKIYPSQGGGSSTFEGLSDTPVGYDNGKILESTANGTQWVDPPAGTTEFKNLTDTPNNFDNGKILESTANGLVWVDKPAGGGGGGGGSSTFEGLTNTPSTFAGTAGQYVTVNSNEDGVQFSELDLAGSNLNFVASQNPVQFLHKPLTSNITSNQTISDFNFTNLEVGKTYKLNAHMSFNSNIDTSLMKVDIFNGIKKLASLSNKGKSTTVSTSIMFIAEVGSVHAVADAGFTSSEYIAGDPDISFVQIEMPVSAIVSVDQQTLPPTPSPAGGIFAISEINARAGVFDLQEEELSQLIGPFSMQISEVQTRVQIEDTTSQTFGASFPAFSVLKIGDMKANVIIGNLNEDGTASSKIPSDTANTVNSDYRWGN